MKLTIVNTSGKNLSLPGPLAAYATGGGLAPGASVSGTVTQHDVDKCAGELALLKSKNYITYTVALDTTMDDQLEGVLVGEIQTAVVALTNAQIKALHATPVQLVAAPGAGKVIVPVNATVYLKYGGTNAFTSAAASVLAVKRAGGADILIGGPQAFVQATASGVNWLCDAATTAAPSDSKTLSDNIALQIWNNNATEIAGNAGNDNTMVVVVQYRVDSAPAGW